MKTTKFYLNAFMLLITLTFLASCEDDLNKYPTIAYAPCEDTNVAIDANIISDFECQANVDLTGVEAVRNPAEIQINTSRFVGKYIDGTGAWDALIIDYGAPIDLSTYNTFKLKIRTAISGTLIVKLEGGTSTPSEKTANVSGNNGWAEYSFDFSDQFNQNHNKLILFFNAGVDTGGTDAYFIDDLKFDLSGDPCAGVAPNLSIVSDFDCQMNQDTPEVEKIATPNKNDVNSSKFSGKYIDEVGAWDAIIIDFGAPIDLSTKNVFSIKVFAPVAGVLKVKLEGGTSGGIEVDAQITNTGVWEEYTFNFSSQATENHQKIVLFFNAGVDTDGTEVYYMDDLKFISDICSGVAPDLSVINDFNCQQNSVVTCCIPNQIVVNPDLNAANPSNAVLEVTDNGTEPFDALVLDYGGVIDLITNNYLRIKILSTRAVPLLAKLEGGTSGGKEVWGAITTTDAWTEYLFDFSDQAAENHQKVVLFFNGGQADGTASDIYYIDDVRFSEFDPCFGVSTDISIVNDFECQQNYDVVCCVDTVIIDNPDVSGINTSASVLEVTDNGTEPFDALVFDFGNVIDLSVKNQLKIKILSTATVPLLAKLEGGTSGGKEVWGAITTANAWTEYTFDFSDQAAANHKKVVFFFNGGETNGTATDIYYIDDIKWQ
jgi:molybdopterin-binding protein